MTTEEAYKIGREYARQAMDHTQQQVDEWSEPISGYLLEVFWLGFKAEVDE